MGFNKPHQEPIGHLVVFSQFQGHSVTDGYSAETQGDSYVWF